MPISGTVENGIYFDHPFHAKSTCFGKCFFAMIAIPL